MAKGKRRSGGSGVVNIKPRKPIVYALTGSGYLLGASAVCMLFGFIFFGIEYQWVHILISVVFFAPMMMLGFVMGRGAGDRDFRIEMQKLPSEDKHRKPVIVNPYMGAVYTAFFVGIILLLSLIGCAASVHWLKVITAFVALPVSLFFYGIGVIKGPNGAMGTEGVSEAIVWDWTSFAAVIIYVLLLAVMYAVGYYLNVTKLKRRQAQLLTEMHTVRR